VHDQPEQRRTEAERDAGVGEGPAGDLEQRGRRRGIRDVGQRRQRTIADDECEAALGLVPVDRGDRGPGDQIPTIGDRLQADLQAIRFI